MRAVCREEIKALEALRQSEYVYKRRLSRHDNAPAEEKDVRACKRRLMKAHDMRDHLIAMQSPTSDKCPDSLRTVVVYDTTVSSDRIKTFEDVKAILRMSEPKKVLSKDLDKTYTPRCVLPPLLAGDFATLQNISMREHAILSLLIRWIINARPSEKSVRSAAQSMKAVKHIAALTSFAQRLRRRGGQLKG
jgi:hypothetical protein